MRIVHVINAHTMGGAELFVAALVRRAAARGFEQLVLNPFAQPSSTDFVELVAPARHESRPCDRLMAAPGLWRWLRGEIYRFRPDVIHVVLFPATVAMAMVPKPPGSVRLLTNMYGPGLRVAPHGRLKQPLDKWAVRRFDHVIAISESVREHLTSSYGYPASRTTVIPLGWEGTPAATGGDHRPTVICVAHFRPEKGHTILVKAFALVHRQLPDARLLLIGRGELEAEIRREIKELGLDESVEFAGSVDDVWPYLARSDVFALPSLSEAYGIAVAEAMAAGLPVVASAVGGVPELVDEGVTGELFPVGNHHALAGHLLRLLESPSLRRRMGAAARVAAAPLGREHSLDRHLALSERLATGTRQDLGD